MAQGAWDTGTWDAALWDSLPVSGNGATGAAGTPGIAATVALTGTTATGAAGTVAYSVDVALSGVEATGLAGTESESDTVTLSGVEAVGAAGDVAHGGVTIALSGVEASGTAGTVVYVPAPVIIDFDTHDGDKFKEKLKREKAQNKKRRAEILATFERLVEGKQALPAEITQPYVKTFAKAAKIPEINNEQINKLITDLDNMQQIWQQHLEADDEEVLALL